MISAPEVFSVAMDELPGYTFPVDWWSLGVTLYELLARGRPYDIHSATSLAHIKSLFNNPIHFPSRWSANIVTLFSKVTRPSPIVCPFYNFPPLDSKTYIFIREKKKNMETYENLPASQLWGNVNRAVNKNYFLQLLIKG